MRFSLILLASSLMPLMAADYFPLANGNTWTYRDSKSGQAQTVRVGTPLLIDGKVYHTLKGYAGSDLMVRVDERGQLVYLDPDASRESILTPLVPFSGGWWNVGYRACEDAEAQAQERPGKHEGPAGQFGEALEVKYRSASCRDVGVTLEQFVDNIGMVRRVEDSIAGPREYNLVYAKVGKQVIEAQPTGRFSVTVAHKAGADVADVTIRLETGGPVIKLPFNSTQEFEIVLKDEAGNVRWKWSDLRVFAPTLRERDVAVEWSTTVRMPVPDFQGRPNVPYTITAWLTTTEDGPKYAATAPVFLANGASVLPQ